MEQQQIQRLTATFEDHAQQTETGVEFWLARDLQHLLGYGKWDNFQSVISKAKTACELSGHAIADHFADVGKMVGLGSGSQREIDDVMLTRYACYLIAQNGDARKQQIAFAQTYFAMQTRRAELIEQRLLETERVQTRKKLSDIPSMRLVKDQGGHAIAVYPKNKRGAKNKAISLIEEGRANLAVIADHSENSAMDKAVKAMIDKVAADRAIKEANG